MSRDYNVYDPELARDSRVADRVDRARLEAIEDLAGRIRGAKQRIRVWEAELRKLERIGGLDVG